MLVLVHALALLAPVPLDVGWAGCPDVMASEVAARTDETGHSRRCGVGISILGFEIGLGGPECFPHRFVYPAHQTCLGVVNEGTMCAPDDPMVVTEEKCECDRLALFGTGFTLPGCTCENSGNAGHIEDFKTAPCTLDNTHGPILQGGTR